MSQVKYSNDNSSNYSITIESDCIYNENYEEESIQGNELIMEQEIETFNPSPNNIKEESKV